MAFSTRKSQWIDEKGALRAAFISTIENARSRSICRGQGLGQGSCPLKGLKGISGQRKGDGERHRRVGRSE